MSRRADALASRIAAVKRRLLQGGMLQEVQWGREGGAPDIRGRRTVTYTPIDALIQQRPGLDRGAVSTERSDDTTLVIFDPLAIIDSDTFRWGDPPDTYKIKAVDGVVQDEDTGVRFASEVTVIR